MTSRAQSARWLFRVLPAPAYDPPYDEERPPDWYAPDALQPLLDLPGLPGPARWAGPAGLPSRPTRAEPPDRAPAGASPATTAAAVRFVNTCLEILNGYRPVTHFRALSAPLAAATVLEAMTQAIRRLRPATRRDGLVKLRAMRTCEPRAGVAEIALVIATGGGKASGNGTSNGTGPGGGRGGAANRDGQPGRAWGLAYRLERQHGRWQCTAARMLLPPDRQ